MPRPTLLLALCAMALAACPADPTPGRDACASTACTDAPTPMDAPRGDVAAGCTPESCSQPGSACLHGACARDCRPSNATGCPAATVCDFTDGQCRPPGDGVLTGGFTACPSSAAPARSCGPGTLCDGAGSCVIAFGCAGLDCDEAGRCWARSCPTERPPPRCTPAPLARMNQADFVGSLANGSDREGAFDLGFDDVCAAYTVTMISGPDYLRQLTAAGQLTVWQSTTNLNMGEVAVLRVPGLEGSADLGDVAATYICCATCGCVETGADGRLGVVHLDRASATRPLPNVLPAMPTTGMGPFGNATLDTGPYGLTWGGDRALYAGNVTANGDFTRVDLGTLTRTPVAMFPARVVAATPFDLQRVLVATQGGAVYLLTVRDGTFVPWATLPADVTSLRRDEFTGRVYAELHSTPPRIVQISADGTSVVMFQTPPRLGRIAIAPDGYLYHLSVFPAVNWMAGDSIVRWQLPARR